jgi:hypothetical protein
LHFFALAYQNSPGLPKARYHAPLIHEPIQDRRLYAHGLYRGEAKLGYALMCGTGLMRRKERRL